MELYYNFTGQKGETLFKSIPESYFEERMRLETDYAEEAALPKGEEREYFIEQCLWNKLDGDELDAIRDSHPELQGKPNSAIKEWLHSHECPDVDEGKLISDWAYERSCDMHSNGWMYDHFDHEDDAETALGMGFVSYPPFDDGKKRYVDGGENTIPANIANQIRSLHEQFQLGMPEEEKEKIQAASNKLEKDAIEKLILIDGFECSRCGETDWPKAYPLNNMPACAACGELICVDCTDQEGTPTPKTEDIAVKYFMEIAENTDRDLGGLSTGAVCYDCGYCDYDFVYDFLELVGCPIPETFKDEESFKVAERMMHAV